MLLIKITAAWVSSFSGICSQYDIQAGDRYEAAALTQFLFGVANGDHPAKPPKA